MIIGLLLTALGLAAAALLSGVRIIQQYERGVVFRFGRVLDTVRGPGLAMIIPGVDRLRKVNMQIVTMPVPAQDGITRDNVTVKVDAVVYFSVADPVRAIVNVQDYLFAVLQVAQTSLRSVIGKSELDDLLSNRERLNQGLEMMIDNPALGWGIHIDRVEIKDVLLPDSMKPVCVATAPADAACRYPANSCARHRPWTRTPNMAGSASRHSSCRPSALSAITIASAVRPVWPKMTVSTALTLASTAGLSGPVARISCVTAKALSHSPRHA